MPVPAIPLITLSTDFGLDDHYVGVMKGVMLGINQKLRLVDICHRIRSHSVQAAAYILEAAYAYFPPGTVHLIVVDPGVGSRRRPVLACCDNYYFVAPDNGVLSLIRQREKTMTVFEITSSEYFLPNISHTFHGRDIFAPVAAWLTKGVAPRRLGEQIEDYMLLDLPKPEILESGVVSGEIIQVDKFGNLISNIKAELFAQARNKWGNKFYLQLGERRISRLIEYYAQAASGEVCILVGSSGQLELITNEKRADKVLGIKIGQKLKLIFKE